MLIASLIRRARRTISECISECMLIASLIR